MWKLLLDQRNTLVFKPGELSHPFGTSSFLFFTFRSTCWPPSLPNHYTLLRLSTTRGRGDRILNDRLCEKRVASRCCAVKSGNATSESSGATARLPVSPVKKGADERQLSAAGILSRERGAV